MSFFAELKRRNVIRVGVAYLVATWLLLQVVDVLSPILELPAWAPKLIFLILAVGFVPVLIFAWAFELTPEGLKREKEVNRDSSITHVTAKKLDYVTIGLLVAAILVVAFDRFLPQSAPENTGITQVSVPSQTAISLENGAASSMTAKETAPEQVIAPPPKSIAVLPFVNMSEDAANEYFSDGISEEILNALAKVTDLKVAGRTSSFAFKGQNQDLRKIGGALNVSHILEGSVRKAGNRVRITAQLIKADDGYHVWSENYDRELDDIFAIQDEISAAILQELKAHLIGDQSSAVARTDAQAYDLYLLASQRIYERNQASLEMAADLLNRAIAIDPGYAPALAQLGIATFLLSENSYGDLPVAVAQSKAKGFFDHALQVDPDLAEAMAGLGLYYAYGQSDFDQAIEWLEKALAINPNLINASVWLSASLNDKGALRKSRQILEEAFARDPLHPAAYNNLAQYYATEGRSQQARSMLGRLEAYAPGDAGLSAAIGKVEVMAGNYAKADGLLTRAVEKEPLNWSDRSWLSVAAFVTAQYERVAEMGTDNFKALALDRLGRTEEAMLLGVKWVSEGNDPGFYLNVLVNNGRFKEVIQFIESRWKSLDELDRAFPDRSGFGAYKLGFLAHAYSREGLESKYQDAMARMKASLDSQVAEGADNAILHQSQAYHAALAGDFDAALHWLEVVQAQGGIPALDLGSEYSVFAPLRGDPRFETLLSRITEHVNEERATLGLDPVSA